MSGTQGQAFNGVIHCFCRHIPAQLLLTCDSVAVDHIAGADSRAKGVLHLAHYASLAQ